VNAKVKGLAKLSSSSLQPGSSCGLNTQLAKAEAAGCTPHWPPRKSRNRLTLRGRPVPRRSVARESSDLELHVPVSTIRVPVKTCSKTAVPVSPFQRPPDSCKMPSHAQELSHTLRSLLFGTHLDKMGFEFICS
jgi:hypothetical protein